MNQPKKKFNFKKTNKKKIKIKQSKGKLEKDEINKLTQSKLNIGELNPSELNNFDQLPLSKNTQKGLLENCFIEPTKVQRQTLIHSLQGLDVVAAAKTGSGKTLAFIIPLLELLYSKLWSPLDGLGGLVITPTRELAYQIFEVLNKVGKEHNFSVGLVIGGKDLRFEWTRVHRCNIMICTPGRLLQHMTENPDFTTANVQLLVLDEADQCLSLGFSETMNLVLEELPSERQTLLFSATQTRDVEALIRAGCQSPIFCSAHEYSSSVTPKTLQESYVVCQDEDKVAFLWSFIRNHRRHKILVFVATCKQVKFLSDLFTWLRSGVTVTGLHGDMHQLRRMAVYDQFCRKKHAILFATDVAARGLDIPCVDWVVQLDCAEDATTYIHRAGRTARHASSGEALLLLTAAQEEPMVAALRQANVPIERIDVGPGKLQSIQLKMEFVVSKHLELKEEAERAFKAYLKHVAHMRDKKVFDVAHIQVDAFARSLGLTATPRVRFVERQLKNRNLTKDKQLKNSKTMKDADDAPPLDPKQMKTFNLDVNDSDDDDEAERDFDFMTGSKGDPALPDQEGEGGDDLSKDLSLFAKVRRGVVSKYDVARDVMRSEVRVNTVVKFDDAGEELEEDAQPSHQQEEKLEVRARGESSAPSLRIADMRDVIRAQDRTDKSSNAQRLKERRRKEKDRLKEEKKEIQEAKERAKENEEEGEEEEEEEGEEEEEEDGGASESESESESDVDSTTRDIIDDLPDPDAVYRGRRCSGSEESESGSEESEEGGSEEREEERSSGDEEANQSQTAAAAKGKKSFSGKRKAREKAREAKRARLAEREEGEREALSFGDKEDLALFLLKGGR